MSKKLIRFDWAVKKLLRNKANFLVASKPFVRKRFNPTNPYSDKKTSF
ncbi:MAG: hypothetical protein JJT94_01730 [Bernardetiaceae bacterium]|nr:hypothetical protein [Bernardetiaceae bacterium]